MKLLTLTLLLPLMAHAAVDGTVVNGTTGKPQPNATVTLFKVGGNGPESIQSVKSGPDGKFLITADAEGQGPRLVQAAFDGAVYNHMIPPGMPSSGITVTVYQSSAKPGAAQVEQHMMLLEPTARTSPSAKATSSRTTARSLTTTPPTALFVSGSPPPRKAKPRSTYWPLAACRSAARPRRPRSPTS